MLIDCDGQSLDTDDMIKPLVQDPYLLDLYISQDFSKVFGAYMDVAKDVVINRISGSMLQIVNDRIGLPDLARALEAEKLKKTS